MRNVKKLFKAERGTHKGKVKVTRGGKTFYREQMVGRKELEQVNVPKMSEHEKYKKEYERLRVIPMPEGETMEEGFKRTAAVNVARRKMQEADPGFKDEQKKWAKAHEERLKEMDTPPDPKDRINTNNIKKDMIIYHEDEAHKLWRVIKVMRVNVYLLPDPPMPHDDPQKVRKDSLQYWVEEKIQKSEIIDVMKLMRGTGKTKVPVHRESGVKLEYRRTGKKESPRKGTGKMDKFPDDIKKEILSLRSLNYSGSKIKDQIENLIDTRSDEYRDKLRKLGLVKPKLRFRTDEAKLTLTSQALTDWAKKQGVESTKKRTSAVDAEKVKHDDTKKELNRADKKIVELEVKSKHNLEEIKLVQESKQESDRIRQQLGKDNMDLKSKLKSCLAGDKNDT